jgi:LacI family transcriptional regulator
MRRLLDRPLQPTAVFASNDMIAIGATQQAQAEGINVPDEISIVGVDDVPLAAMIAPALTTVAQPMRAMGRTAVELLLQVIRERPVAYARVTLETELRVRASTGPAPAFDWRERAAR